MLPILLLTMQNLQAMQTATNDKRQELKNICAAIKQKVAAGEFKTINEGLAKYYEQQGHTNLKSFRKWKEEGFFVKRGEQALLFWGEPINAKHNEEEITFFPLAFLFSEKQVQLSNFQTK